MHQDSTQYEIFPDRLHLRRVDASRNQRQFYLMAVQRDLFDGAKLVPEWARIGSSGQIKTSHHADEEPTMNDLAGVVSAKRKCGYRA